jgi:hypothetical protein
MALQVVERIEMNAINSASLHFPGYSNMPSSACKPWIYADDRPPECGTESQALAVFIKLIDPEVEIVKDRKGNRLA